METDSSLLAEQKARLGAERKRFAALLAALLLAAACLPFFTSIFQTQLLTGALILGITAMSFALLAGFGGMIHNGNLEDYAESGPYLGCRALFREYAAVGYDVTANWRVLAQIEHSSHANLCGRPNNGLTRAGIQIGYKF